MKEASAFGIWMTGLPSAGKSTITRELAALLHARGVFPVVLESDVIRRILTPEPTYLPEERDRFYRQLAELGAMITRCGVPVIIDATAAKRQYRDLGRSMIPLFLEVLVQCPLEECRQRDPKGIYAAAASGSATTVPGIHVAYETPLAPDVALDGRASPHRNAARIIEQLIKLQYV